MADSALPPPFVEEELRILHRVVHALFEGASEREVGEVLGALTRVEIVRGARLMAMGEPGDAAYVLLRGRLVASQPGRAGQANLLGEIPSGAWVGELALLTGEPRTADVFATRDSVLARFDRELYDRLLGASPSAFRSLARATVKRVMLGQSRRRRPEVSNIVFAFRGEGPFPKEHFERFVFSLRVHGATQAIRAADSDVRLRLERGQHADLQGWLDNLEKHASFLAMGCDASDPEWCRIALGVADRVVVVTETPAEAAPGALERLIEEHARGIPVDLALIHPRGDIEPGAAPLLATGRFSRHFHLREGRRDDHPRLARFLANRSVGLVLAGGGARGFAHLGVLRALHERRIPVDLVCGASMGSVVAACMAQGLAPDEVQRRMREAFHGQNPLSDYALLPYFGLMRGRRMEGVLREAFGAGLIEDLPLPFFCVTANLSRASTAYLDRGPVWKALRASVSIPGILPPVSYPDGRHVDGGVIDNLPVDHARDLGVDRIIASDLSVAPSDHTHWEELPSTLALLWDRFFRSQRRYDVSSIFSTMIEATFVASVERRVEAATRADLAFCSPVSDIPLLSFASFDAAVDRGYRHAVERLEAATPFDDTPRDPTGRRLDALVLTLNTLPP